VADHAGKTVYETIAPRCSITTSAREVTLASMISLDDGNENERVMVQHPTVDVKAGAFSLHIISQESGEMN
jgi:hypothetical protein